MRQASEPQTTEQLSNREAIILAAERLFAEYGLHGVSLRQINDAAGQRNTSAIQYHFGSREALIEAVFAHRMQQINPRREEMLAALDQSHEAKDVRALVGVLVWPSAEELRPRPEGNYYARFLAQVAREKTPPPTHLAVGWTRTVEALMGLISYLPREIVEVRILAAGEFCAHALATFEANGDGGSPAFDVKVETLIDMVTAALQAPISFASMEALQKASGKKGAKKADA